MAFSEKVLTLDGRALLLRDIEPNDMKALYRCFDRLTPQDIRRRFLYAMTELPEPLAHRLCHINPQRESALVLLDLTIQPHEIRGVGRIYVDITHNDAEFSILIEQSWNRCGLGVLLLNHLLQDCQRRGLSEIRGYVLLENRPMLQLCKELGFTRQLMPDEPGTALVSLRL